MPEKIGNAARFFDKREALVVKITSKGGEVGWGETWAMPAPAGALIQNVLATEILGEDSQYPQKLWRKLSRFIINDRRGLTHMAISALDIAVWDLAARMAKKPLSDFLGGALRKNLTAYISGPFVKPVIDPYAHYNKEIEDYLEKGYSNIKIRSTKIY
jgi:D-galactarolactone cycloisomerase